MAGSTSFQKKARVKIGQIPGTRPSLYNKQLLVSSGIPSLDIVIGGGLGVGTVMLIEEDVYGNYARLMMKYFAAEAVMTQQSLLLASAETDPQQLMKELPSPVETHPKKGVKSQQSNQPVSVTTSSPSNQDKSQKDNGDSRMKIAWRYENKPTIESSPVSNISFGHYYDLTKTMDETRVEKTDVSFSRPTDTSEEDHRSPIPGMNPCYCRLLGDIQEKISSGNFGTDCDAKERKIFRIGVHSLGSPVWLENGGVRCGGQSGPSYDPSLALFILALRSLLRSAFAVAVITVPTHLFQEESHVQRLHGMSDVVIRLDSFAGSDKEKNPIFKEYHGLLQLLKLPRVNSMVPTQPETSDLAFKLRRKKFTIEILHLPPDLADNTSRSQDDGGVGLLAKKSGGCGGGSSKLDF